MSEPEKLTCQRMMRLKIGQDYQNRPQYATEKCGRPASEVEIKGALSVVKAVLCPKHALDADKSAFLSVNGFTADNVAKDAAEKGYKQTRIEPAIR